MYSLNAYDIPLNDQFVIAIEYNEYGAVPLTNDGHDELA
jgi:hypothetical protein